MESGQRLRVVLAVASFVALSLFFALQYRRRRKQESRSSSCYLRADSKPQHSFKRVLADNSFAPFKHLKLKDSDGGELLKNSSMSLLPVSLTLFLFFLRRNLERNLLPISLSLEIVLRKSQLYDAFVS